MIKTAHKMTHNYPKITFISDLQRTYFDPEVMRKGNSKEESNNGVLLISLMKMFNNQMKLLHGLDDMCHWSD